MGTVLASAVGSTDPTLVHQSSQGTGRRGLPTDSVCTASRRECCFAREAGVGVHAQALPPEKDAERHTPPEGVIDKMLRISGVERESRFKK